MRVGSWYFFVNTIKIINLFCEYRVISLTLPIISNISTAMTTMPLNIQYSKYQSVINQIMIDYACYQVIRLGFEPKTHSLEGCCSIQLSYRTPISLSMQIKKSRPITSLHSFSDCKVTHNFPIFQIFSSSFQYFYHRKT